MRAFFWRVESRIRIRRRHGFAVVVAVLAVTIPVMAASGAQGPSGAAATGAGWVTAWGASPVVGSDIPGSTCPAGTGLTDQTVRNVVFLSAGGDRVRIRLTNAFGTQAMQVTHASVAVQAAGATAARTDVNTWITTSHAFDGVIDFAAAVADPGHPTALNSTDDSGDRAHREPHACWRVP